ncbi:hypothetical protein HYH02_001465 [Chlamydomonas schloesseri]|uniref:Uncharacterized protein n=1 Tax=Chlamydomonas schloesseri TaxID=2026947 RepID=A0A836BCH8_9CHLO|nr:hypothetical protein HYH02_001465 [Chlamydomonas schloesseri]|eukprot:KAG2454446.1 hypothetical protein HYH02_001465 [Chlamydomonas schloesseri]
MLRPRGLLTPPAMAMAPLLVAAALVASFSGAGAAPRPPPAGPKPQQGRVIEYGGNYLGGYIPQQDAPKDLLQSGVWGVAAGHYHSMAIYGKSRKVVEWPPANASFGYYNPDPSTQRLQPENLVNVVAVSAGQHHSLALTKTGKVVFWTRQLLGNASDDLPPLLGPKAKAKVKAIAAGRGGYSMALLNNGSIIEWGPARNYSDNATWYRPPPPGLVISFPEGDVNGAINGNVSVPAPRLRAQAIAAGWDHSLALLENGTVVAWGGRRGQYQAFLSWRAMNVSADAKQDVVAIAAGNQHSLALLANGTVVAWGTVLANAAGATCAAEGCVTYPPPAGPNNVPAEALKDVTAISAGSLFGMALLKGGRVVVWGKSTGYLYINFVPDDAQSGVFAIAGGSAHYLAVKATG